MELCAHTVHVWSVDLDHWSPESFGGVLSADEQARASRFKFEQLRDRFIICRGLLRYCLSQYLAVEPVQVHFTYGAKGKPALQSSAGLAFNLSHSQNRAVYAFSQENIGVDLEQISDSTPYLELAARFFLPQEYQQLVALPAPQQQRAFFQTWTRKEACIKLRGTSLGEDLSRIQVPVIFTDPAQQSQQIAYGLDLALWEDCAAAIALSAPWHRVQCWQWCPSVPKTEILVPTQCRQEFELHPEDFWSGWLTTAYNVGNDKKSRQ
ncbi:4'-phosphopantetheinyl transferase superfamily protein [Synechococcales cyanobacterium C]|uniref:4'-phosphopantetheinyl transferase superfamily protein n=1 Tax=Petrachloros mirabilis ULC683 TaxID=2781853 RepID=A0A8K1ZXQ6_9CYAN|nr:4'-phosphopantetheinyl transferase superfamily protein [Petrachloros mirabilis]NCJ05587.1 4'-phosphopantetheinyl transferase superfamily protein [Petrachloros mirabilis ULC683]